MIQEQNLAQEADERKAASVRKPVRLPRPRVPDRRRAAVTQPTQPITWPATCKDAAHILVGLLLGLAIVARSWACGGLLAAMTVVEAYAFFTTH